MPITTFLWFNAEAEEAAKFYVSVFKNARLGGVHRYGEAGPGPKGSVMLVEFEIEGQRFAALNGDSQFKFTPAVSFAVNSRTQAEVDELWAKLTADGGAEVACGWLTDKFGVSWQIIPEGTVDLVTGADPKKSQAAMRAMFGMKKLDIAVMRKAYEEA